MNGGPDGGTNTDLEDLIARHLDGGLEAEDQRRLARKLADSLEARRTFARYLRLEAAMTRLAAARQLALPAAAGERGGVVTPAASRADGSTRAAPGVPLATIAMAGCLLAALLLAPLLMPWGERGEPRGSEIDLLAEEWLRLQRGMPAEEPVEAAVAPADEAFVATALADGPGDDEPEPVAAPPSWLVAAMADTETDAATPDEG
jgi:hypothetical protein